MEHHVLASFLLAARAARAFTSAARLFSKVISAGDFCGNDPLPENIKPWTSSIDCIRSSNDLCDNSSHALLRSLIPQVTSHFSFLNTDPHGNTTNGLCCAQGLFCVPIRIGSDVINFGLNGGFASNAIAPA